MTDWPDKMTKNVPIHTTYTEILFTPSTIVTLNTIHTTRIKQIYLRTVKTHCNIQIIFRLSNKNTHMCALCIFFLLQPSFCLGVWNRRPYPGVHTKSWYLGIWLQTEQQTITAFCELVYIFKLMYMIRDHCVGSQCPCCSGQHAGLLHSWQGFHSLPSQSACNVQWGMGVFVTCWIWILMYSDSVSRNY